MHPATPAMTLTPSGPRPVETEFATMVTGENIRIIIRRSIINPLLIALVCLVAGSFIEYISDDFARNLRLIGVTLPIAMTIWALARPRRDVISEWDTFIPGAAAAAPFATASLHQNLGALVTTHDRGHGVMSTASIRGPHGTYQLVATCQAYYGGLYFGLSLVRSSTNLGQVRAWLKSMHTGGSAGPLAAAAQIRALRYSAHATIDSVRAQLFNHHPVTGSPVPAPVIPESYITNYPTHGVGWVIAAGISTVALAIMVIIYISVQ